MTKPKQYLVVESTSTRRSVDPKADDFEEWLDFVPGDVVKRADLPKHVPVDEWLESGHWQEAT